MDNGDKDNVSDIFSSTLSLKKNIQFFQHHIAVINSFSTTC